jgi:hypothetical protein
MFNPAHPYALNMEFTKITKVISIAAGYSIYEAHLMQKTLIMLGIVLVVVGLLWPWLGKIPFGRLPGDIIIDKPGLKFYFPITSMILVSLVISIIFWFFKK